MLLTPLSSEERLNGGFTHKVNLTYADLTETAANTAQTIAIFTAPVGTVIEKVATRVVTAFEDASDNALNTTTLIVGDDGNDDRYIASQELNVNGSEVLYKLSPVGTTTSPFVYTTANTVDAIFGSMAAKALNDIDTGEVNIYLAVTDLTKL
jgi:hypothetical protein